MRSRIVGISVCALSSALVVGCQSAPKTAEIDWETPGSVATLDRATMGDPYELEDVDGVSRCYIDGVFCVSSQPSAEALRGFAEDGVTVVINLRTESEMSKVDFDEAEVCAEAGMEYVYIPLGGKDRVYPPEAVETFAEALERHDGKALIHCASGGRATHLYMAYLIKHLGYELDEALAVGSGLTYRPMPLELLLDREIGYHWAE